MRVDTTSSCRRHRHKPLSVFQLVVILIVAKSDLVASYRDDWYSFVSFENTNEWGEAYKYTCASRVTGIDLFREPRELNHRNDLRGRRELRTPVRFSSKQALKSPENSTLHIYNNPGIRKGYSVSYGFQRNKECLHGQDSDCVVFPELARVRAVVLNAERFTQKQNLNYVKDHFLIEKPEQFVTILNGGSIFERKFYEAVFLGGYTDDPSRSSHQIDGKKYPLEIYMYFLDETVPSVSLSTILVVLVEESDKDNPHIKPVINAIEHKLYEADRRFLEQNKAMIRRERLVHHMKHTTYYDVYDIRNHAADRQFIVQESIPPSMENEATFTRFVEPFERMQALEADLYFLLEDEHKVKELYQENDKFIDDVFQRRSTYPIPTNFTEYQMMALLVGEYGYVSSRENGTPSCNEIIKMIVESGTFYDGEDLNKFKNTSQVPTGDHAKAFIDVVVEVCKHFNESFKDLFTKNMDEKQMKILTVEEKYAFIGDFIQDRKDRERVNKLVYDHFHGPNSSQWHEYNGTEEIPDYAYPQQKLHIVDGINDLIIRYEKSEIFKAILKRIQVAIDNIAHKLGHENGQLMRDVFLYLKYGDKADNLKSTRARVHDELFNRQLPEFEKKVTLVEYGGLGMDEDDAKELGQLSPVKALVDDAFQMSWLIPQYGGYYYYAGASPLPPCFRADNVIVFKQPISMSRLQIDILTRVPTSFDRTEDIRCTTPAIHDTRFEIELSGVDTEKSRVEEVEVPIYDQKRNQLFMGHDGVHTNAVEEWTKLQRAREGSGSIGGNSADMVVIIVMLLVVIYLIKY